MLHKSSVYFLLVAAVMACGGGGDAAVSDSATAAAATALAKADSNRIRREAASAGLAGRMSIVDTLAASGQRPLLRESFSYEAYGRDPFRSMITTSDRGPALTDLILIAILYDERDSGNSVAVFRENGSNRRFTVNPGERIGRLYVSRVTRDNATLRFDDYGTTREQTYTLRPTEDEG